MYSLPLSRTLQFYNHLLRSRLKYEILMKIPNSRENLFTFVKAGFFSTCPSSNPTFGSSEKDAKELSEEFPQAKTTFQRVINEAFLVLDSPRIEPSVTIKQIADEMKTNQNLWVTTISMDWPEKFIVEGVSSRKSDSEHTAYLYACQKLKECGTLDGKNNPVLPNQIFTFADKQILNAKAELANIFQLVWRKLGDEGVLPQYENSQVSALVGNIPLWKSFLTLKYPEYKVFVGHSHRATDAERVASAKALHWLHAVGFINRKKQPISYTKQEEKQMYDNQKLPYPLVLPEDLTERLSEVIREYEKLKDVYGDGLVHISCKNEIEQSTVPAVIRNLFTERPYIEPAEEVLEERSRDLLRQQTSARLRLQSLVHNRETLPIFERREQILKLIEENQVVVLSGETGCGKSTQVPQYIFESFVEKMNGAKCNIVIAQPRRISAISVAEYVAFERGEEVGSSVGHHIRLHKNLPNGNGSILFCTTGILLRKLCANRKLKGVSHIIVDEVHERSTHIDFLLILLQDILRTNKDLKLILMSASFNTSVFSKYFNNCPVIHIPGRLYPVTEHFLDDLPLDVTGYDGSNKLIFNASLIARVITHVNKTQPEGAILCFLPGWTEIKAVFVYLTELLGNESSYLVRFIHSKLLPGEQKLIFEHPPPGVRKIILGTNVAETSVTIEDVVYVVDSGLHKGTTFDAEKGIASLGLKWVTKANVRQRRGRAGRVQPGICYHLFARKVFAEMEDYPKAEILSNTLEKAVLDCKVYFPDTKAEDFLSMALQPPSRLSIQVGVKELQTLGILDENENLTILGSMVKNFATHPRLSVALIYSTYLRCLDPILTTCAMLTVPQDPFNDVLEKSSDIKQVKLNHSAVLLSDHLALYKLYREWSNIPDEERASFVEQNLLDNDSMTFVKQLKGLFIENMHEIGVIPQPHSNNSTLNTNSDNTGIILAVLTAAFYPNVIKVVQGEIKNGRMHKDTIIYQTLRNHNALIQMESVASKLYEFPSPYLAYFSAINSEARRKVMTSAVSSISGISLALFSGQQLHVKETTENRFDVRDGVLIVDNNEKLQFSCSQNDLQKLHKFRHLLDECFQIYLHEIKYQGSIPHKNIVEFLDSKVVPVLRELLSITSVPFIPGRKFELVNGHIVDSEL